MWGKKQNWRAVPTSALVKKLNLWLVVAAAMVLAACGGPASAPQAAQGSQKVALIIPGPITDQGWSATAYRGLEDIKSQLGAEIAYTENVQPADAPEHFRGYARDGYSLIFGHGFQFEEAAKASAAEFPNTFFVVTSSQLTQEPNVSSFHVSTRHAGYLLGVVAGLMTESNVIGAIGGQEIPPIVDELDGFEAGAKSVNPDVRVLKSYIGTWSDLGTAKEAAFAMIDQEADVLMGTANEATLGVIEAAQERGIWALGGSGSDLNPAAPDTVLTSAILDYRIGFVLVAELLKKGELTAASRAYGVPENAVYLAPYHDLEAQVPQEVKDRVAAVAADLASGKLDVPK